jgi:tripeptide aminopeptidase
MDLKLLEQIFQTPAITRQEDRMASVIKKTLTANGISYFSDKIGNVYSLNKKGVPLLSAHMDTVQDEVDAALAKFIKIRGNVVSGYGVIGGDDKCGIFIALTLACANLCNFVFSVEEESGGHGIKTFVAEQDLSDIPYGLVLDRRGSSDIICTKNNYGVDAFEKILLEIGKLYGYKESSGTFSDANYLSEKISCANLSVGYYNPHSKSEFVDVDDLKVAMNFTHSIIKNVTEKFEVPSKAKVYTYTYPAKATPSKPFSHSYPGDVDLGDICAFCNTQKEKTIFSKVVNDFVCIDCCRQLRE